VLADSGNVYDTTITGGRLGMMVFGQQDVIWSRLEARCFDRYIHPYAYSPHYSPYISYDTSWENLIKHQHISRLGSFLLFS